VDNTKETFMISKLLVGSLRVLLGKGYPEN